MREAGLRMENPVWRKMASAEVTGLPTERLAAHNQVPIVVRKSSQIKGQSHESIEIRLISPPLAHSFFLF